MDTDGSGALSKEELLEGYRAIYGEDFDEKEVDDLMDMADVNDDGVISYSEWLITSMDRQKLLTQDKIEAAFAGFDADKSKTVSFDEIKNFLFGSKGFDEAYLHKIMAKYDSDGQEDITLNDFKNLMFDLLS